MKVSTDVKFQDYVSIDEDLIVAKYPTDEEILISKLKSKASNTIDPGSEHNVNEIPALSTLMEVTAYIPFDKIVESIEY